MYYYFVRSVAGVVHAPDPFELVGRFQLFSDTLTLLHLLYEKIKHLISFIIDLVEMTDQLAVCKQSEVYGFMVILQVLFTKRTILPIMHFFRFR